MKDLFKLILGVLASLFKSRAKAGSRNPDPTATDQCASPAGTETTAPQQYRSFSVCLALSLVPLRPWRDCDCQAGDDHSLAPCWVSSLLALAIAQPCWQTEGLGCARSCRATAPHRNAISSSREERRHRLASRCKCRCSRS